MKWCDMRVRLHAIRIANAIRNPQFSIASSESARDVILRLLLFRRREHRRRAVVFDQRAHIEERRVIAHPRGLLHVVRDDHDRDDRLQAR